MSDDGRALDEAQCRRLFDLPGEEEGEVPLPVGMKAMLEEMVAKETRDFMESIAARNGMWFETEIDKLDRWAEDRRTSLKTELDELDESIKETKKAARLAPNLPEKLERQRALRQLETKRTDAWKAFDEACREIDRQKDALLDEIGRRLEQKLEQDPLFTLRWRLS